MPMKSNNSSYGLVAALIHWLAAVLILLLLASGFRAGQTIDPAIKADILKFHIPLGIAILLLTLIRIIWWWFFDTKPAAIGSDPSWQELSAKAVHVAFYVVILGMVASGIGMIVLSGAGPIIFGGIDKPLANFHSYLPRVPHGLGARLMVLLLVIHAGAALYHHFIKRDVTLKRMWFGSGGKK